jgi:glutaredoxin
VSLASKDSPKGLVVYTKANCPACDKAKAMLDRLDAYYEVKRVDTDLDAMDFIVAQGHRSVPQIYRDGKLLIEGGAAGMEAIGIAGVAELLK